MAKNGVVLLNISPMADGTIPQDQQRVLHELGDWMEVNGDLQMEIYEQAISMMRSSASKRERSTIRSRRDPAVCFVPDG